MLRKNHILASMLSLFAALAIAMPASAQTLERIQQSGTFNIGVVRDQAPFSSVGGDNKATGYAVDLCQRLADAVKSKLGMSKLTLKYTPTTVPAGLGMVASGEVDVLCGAVSDTLKRRERVSFSIPIFNGGIGVLLRKDAPPDLVRVLKGEVAHKGPIWRSTINRGLAEHTYAVDTGTTTEAWVREQIATLGVIATVLQVPDREKGVEMVADREADAYFADRVILRNYTEKSEHADKLMVLDRYFTFEPLALALPRGDEDLRLVADTALSNLYRSDEFLDLYTRYFGKPSDITQMLFKAYARQ